MPVGNDEGRAAIAVPSVETVQWSNPSTRPEERRRAPGSRRRGRRGRHRARRPRCSSPGPRSARPAPTKWAVKVHDVLAASWQSLSPSEPWTAPRTSAWVRPPAGVAERDDTRPRPSDARSAAFWASRRFRTIVPPSSARAPMARMPISPPATMTRIWPRWPAVGGSFAFASVLLERSFAGGRRWASEDHWFTETRASPLMTWPLEPLGDERRHEGERGLRVDAQQVIRSALGHRDWVRRPVRSGPPART